MQATDTPYTGETPTQTVTQSQCAPYSEPPGLSARLFEPFDPVRIRGYTSHGGRLFFDNLVESEVQCAHQLNECQELLNRGLLSRVDVLKAGTTELIGSMTEHDPQARIKAKLAEIMSARMRGEDG